MTETALLLPLQAYLNREYPERGEATITGMTSLNTGWESDVYRFSVQWGDPVRFPPEQLVLRVFPGNDAYEKSASEFRALQLLNQVGYPVPRVDRLERGSSAVGHPFLLMEYIEGQPLWSTMFNGPEERQDRLLRLFCGLFARLHEVDWRAHVENAEQYEPRGAHALIDRQFAAWQPYIGKSPMPGFLPVMEWLQDNKRTVITEKASLVHWDYHPENLLLREDGSAVVIDWTGFDFSDRRFDLAWTLIVVAPTQGMQWRGRILEEYERAAGSKVEHIEYFEVAACLRRLFSVILSLAAEPEQLGMRPGAQVEMLKHAPRLRIIHTLLSSYTGIKIPEVEQFLESTGA